MHHSQIKSQEKKSGRHQSTSSTSQLPKRRSLPRLDRCHFAKKHFWVACLARIMRKQGTHNSPTISAISSLTASDIRKCKSGLQDLLKCETCCSAFRSEFNGHTRDPLTLSPRTDQSDFVRDFLNFDGPGPGRPGP